MSPEISEKALSISAARRFCCSSRSCWLRKPVLAEDRLEPASARSKQRLMYTLRSSVKPDRGADRPESTAEAVRGRGRSTPAVRGRGRFSSTAVAPSRWPVLSGVLRRKCGDAATAVDGRGRLAVAMLRSCKLVMVPIFRSFPVGAVVARSAGSIARGTAVYLNRSLAVFNTVAASLGLNNESMSAAVISVSLACSSPMPKLLFYLTEKFQATFRRSKRVEEPGAAERLAAAEALEAATRHTVLGPESH
eukprot:scaffold80558_cov63-Phaeocystis_antarctica.AAC.2